ncbi:MAG: hypothetical protein Q4G52_07290 [Clostridia bacterium]|nr:hypothetical protein [Clostridia bacterium]
MKMTMRKMFLVFGLVMLSMALVFGAVADEGDSQLGETLNAPTEAGDGPIEPGKTPEDLGKTDGESEGDGNGQTVSNEGKAQLKIASVVRRKPTEQYPAYGSLEKLNLGENFAVTVTDEEGTVLTEDDYVLSWTLKDPAVENVDEEPSLRIGENTVYIKASPKAGSRYTSAVSEPQTLEIVPRQFVASLKLNYTFEKENERQYFSDNYSIDGLDKSAYSVYFKCANGEGSTLMIPSTPGIYRVEAQVSNVSGYAEGTYTLVNWHWDNVRVYKAASAILPSSAATITLPYVEGGYTPSGIIGVSASVPGLDASLYTVDYQEASGKTIQEIGDYLVRVKVYLNDNSEYYLLEGVTETTVPVSIVQTGMLVDVEQKLTQANSYDVTTPADVAKVSVRANVSGTPLLNENKDYQTVYTLDGEEVSGNQTIPVGEHTIGVRVQSLSAAYTNMDGDQGEVFSFRSTPQELTVTYDYGDKWTYLYENEVGLSSLIDVASVQNADGASIEGQLNLTYEVTKDGAPYTNYSNNMLTEPGEYQVKLKAEPRTPDNYTVITGAESDVKSLTIKKRGIKIFKEGNWENSFQYTEQGYSLATCYPICVQIEGDDGQYTDLSGKHTVDYKDETQQPVEELRNLGTYSITVNVTLDSAYTDTNYEITNDVRQAISVTISPIEINVDVSISLQDDSPLNYAKGGYELSTIIKPTVKTVKIDGSSEQLAQGTDYTIEYFVNNQKVTNIEEPGKYTIVPKVTLCSQYAAQDGNQNDVYKAKFSYTSEKLSLEIQKQIITASTEEQQDPKELIYQQAGHDIAQIFPVTVKTSAGDKLQLVGDSNEDGYMLSYTVGGNNVEKLYDADTYEVTAELTLTGEYAKDAYYELSPASLTRTFTITKRKLTLEVYPNPNEILPVTYEESVKHTMGDYFVAKLTDDNNNSNGVTDWAVTYDPETIELSADDGQATTYTITATVTKAYGEEGEALENNYDINVVNLEFEVKAKKIEATAKADTSTFVYSTEGYALTDVFPVTVTVDGKALKEGSDYILEYQTNDKTPIESLTDMGEYKITPYVTLTGKYATSNYDLNAAELTERTFNVDPYPVKVVCKLANDINSYTYLEEGRDLPNIILTEVKAFELDGTTERETLERGKDYDVIYTRVQSQDGDQAITQLTNGGTYQIVTTIELKNGYELQDGEGRPAYAVQYDDKTQQQTIEVTPQEIVVTATAPKNYEFTYSPDKYKLTASDSDPGVFPVTVQFTKVKANGEEETITLERNAEKDGYTLEYVLQEGTTAVEELEEESLTNRGIYQIQPEVELTGKYTATNNYSIQQIEEPTKFTVNPREVSVTYSVKDNQTEFDYRVSGYKLKDILLVQVDILDNEGKNAIQTLEQENGDYTVKYEYTYTNQKKEEVEKNDKTVIDDAGIYKTTTHVKLTGQNNEYASTNKDGECNYVFKGTKQNVSKNDVDLTVNPCKLDWTVEANGKITTGENQFAYRSAKATGKAAGIPMSDALNVSITGFKNAGITEAPECTIEYEITYDEDGAMIGEEVWKQAGEALMVDAREYHVAIRANLSEPEDRNNYTIEKTTIDLEVVKRQVQATQYYKVNGEKSETAEKLWYRPGENGAHEIADYIGVVVETVPFNNDKLDKYYGDYNLDMVNAEEVEEYTDTYSVKYDYVGKEPEDPESIQNAGDYVIHEEFEYNTQNYVLDNKSKDENGDGTLTLTVQPRVIEVSHTSTGFVYNQKEHALADQITLSAKSVQIEGYPEAYYPEVTMDDAAFKAIIAQLTYLAEGQDTFGQNLLDEEGNVEQFTAIEEAGTYEAWEEITLSDPNYELVNKTKENRTTIRVDKATIRSADNEATKEIVYNGQDRLLNAGESELTSETVVASAEGCENRVPASEYRLISDRTLNTIGEYTLSLQLTEECNNYRLADGGVSVKQYVLPHPVAALALAGGVNSDERGVYLFGGENPGVNHVITLTGEPGESVDIILTNGTETLCETSLVFDGTRFANGDAKAGQTASLSFQFADTADNGAVLTIGDKRIAIANNGRYELRVNYTDEENLTEQAAGQNAPKPESTTLGYMWDKTKPEISLQSELHNRDRQTIVIVSEACTLESFKVNDVDRITNSDMEFGAQGEREYTLTWSMDTLMHSGTDALTIESVDLVGNTNTQTFDVERSEGAPLTLTIQPVVNDNGYVDRSEVQVDYVAIFVEGTAGELIQIEQNGAMMTSTAGVKLPMLSRSGTEWAVDKMGGYSGQYSPDSFPNFEQFLLSTCYEDLDAPQADITLIYDDVCLPTVVASAVTEDCRVISCLAERGSYLSFYRNGEPINVQGRIDNYGVFVGSMPYLEKDDILRIIAVDLAGNIDRKEIVVGEEVSSAILDGYLMGRTAIGYVSGNEEMDWVTASYLRIDELKEGITLPLVAANAFIYGEAEIRMDEDGHVTVETVLNDGVKAENDYVGVLTEYDMDSFKNRKAGSVVTNPGKIRDGVWVCFSQNVELSAAQMTESYLIWRNTSDEDYLLYLNRQRSAELSTLIF